MRHLPSLLLATVLLILVGEGFGAFICSGGADCTQTGRNGQPFECTDGANCKKCIGDECWPVQNVDGSKPRRWEENMPIWRKKRSPRRPDPRRCRKMKGRKLEKCLRRSLGRKKRSPRKCKKGLAGAKCRCKGVKGIQMYYCMNGCQCNTSRCCKNRYPLLIPK